MADVTDVLSVQLSEPGFPAFIRLTMPDPFTHAAINPDIWAIIRIPSSQLMLELEKNSHKAGYPSAEKLNSLLKAFRESKPIGTPIIEITDACRPPNFNFLDGRHRITALSQLGAKSIPVAVPWVRTNELIDYFSVDADSR